MPSALGVHLRPAGNLSASLSDGIVGTGNSPSGVIVGGGSGSESEPGGSDIIIKDWDYFDDSPSIAARNTVVATAAAGSNPYHLFRAGNHEQGTFASMEAGGHAGHPYFMRLQGDSDINQQPDYDASIQLGHVADTNNPFCPSSHLLTMDMWVRMSGTGLDDNNWSGIKGFEFLHSSDRTQLGIYNVSDGGPFNYNSQSAITNRYVFQDIFSGGLPGPTSPFRSRATLSPDNNFHLWTMQFKPNATKGVTTSGIGRFFIDGVKIIDISDSGHTAGYLRQRSAQYALDGNIGEKNEAVPGTSVQARQALAQLSVTGILFPGILTYYNIQGGDEIIIDLGGYRLWSRPNPS